MKRYAAAEIGTGIGAFDSVSRGMCLPVTTIDGPATTIGSGSPPVPARSSQGQAFVTANVPCIVEETGVVPTYVPSAGVPEVRASRMSRRRGAPSGVAPRVRVSSTYTSSGRPPASAARAARTVTVTGTVTRPEAVTAERLSAMDRTTRSGSGPVVSTRLAACVAWVAWVACVVCVGPPTPPHARTPATVMTAADRAAVTPHAVASILR